VVEETANKLVRCRWLTILYTTPHVTFAHAKCGQTFFGPTDRRYTCVLFEGKDDSERTKFCTSLPNVHVNEQYLLVVLTGDLLDKYKM